MIAALRLGAVALLMACAAPVRADSADTLRDFVRDVKTGRSTFTQTVTAPDGASIPRLSGAGGRRGGRISQPARLGREIDGSSPRAVRPAGGDLLLAGDGA